VSVFERLDFLYVPSRDVAAEARTSPTSSVLVDMTDDNEQIRALVERWAAAVHGGDMDGVLADHADDVVMFDVPPPYDGVRGIDAYRDTRPPFFEWQARGFTRGRRRFGDTFAVRARSGASRWPTLPRYAPSPCPPRLGSA
jgi:hypothetical protein